MLAEPGAPTFPHSLSFLTFSLAFSTILSHLIYPFYSSLENYKNF